MNGHRSTFNFTEGSGLRDSWKQTSWHKMTVWQKTTQWVMPVWETWGVTGGHVGDTWHIYTRAAWLPTCTFPRFSPPDFSVTPSFNVLAFIIRLAANPMAPVPFCPFCCPFSSPSPPSPFSPSYPSPSAWWWPLDWPVPPPNGAWIFISTFN